MKRKNYFFKVVIIVFIIVGILSACDVGQNPESQKEFNSIAKSLDDYDEASPNFPTTKEDALTVLATVGFVTVQSFIVATGSTSPEPDWVGLKNAISNGDLTYSSSNVSYSVSIDSTTYDVLASADISDLFDYETFDFGSGAPDVAGSLGIYLDADFETETHGLILVDVNNTPSDSGDDEYLPHDVSEDLTITSRLEYNSVDAGTAFEIVDGFLFLSTDFSAETLFEYDHSYDPETVSIDYDGQLTLVLAVSINPGDFILNGGKYVFGITFNGADSIGIDFSTFDINTDLEPLLESLEGNVIMSLDVCKNDGEIVNSYLISVEDWEDVISSLSL